MTHVPKISVVTPSFNQGRYLERTIQSVLGQGYPNLEYIVIDGGSNDESVEILKRYDKQLAYWVSEKDNGQGDAINKGFARSTGEIMTWINSDDLLTPWSLSTAMAVFNAMPSVEWLTGMRGVCDEAGNMIYLRTPNPYCRSFIRWGWYHSHRLEWIQQEGTYWRRSLWDRVGGINPDLYIAMDYDLWMRFAEHAELYQVQALTALFRWHSAQKTSNAIDRYFEEIRKLCRHTGPKEEAAYHLLRGTRNVPVLGGLVRRAFGAYGPRVTYNRREKRWTTGMLPAIS